MYALCSRNTADVISPASAVLSETVSGFTFGWWMAGSDCLRKRADRGGGWLQALVLVTRTACSIQSAAALYGAPYRASARNTARSVIHHRGWIQSTGHGGGQAAKTAR